MNIEYICEKVPTVYSRYPRSLESLTICRWNSTKEAHFPQSVLRSCVLIRPGLQSAISRMTRPDAQPTEPPVRSQGYETTADFKSH